MAIMRSEEKWTMSKELRLKVKRPSVDWMQVIRDIEDEVLKDQVVACYFLLLRDCRHKSSNFCAFQALRHYFSSDRLDYLRWCVYGEVDVVILE